MRFRQAKISELRAEYMFLMAHLCGVKPTDNLRLTDFFQLILGIDKHLEDNSE